MRSHVIGPFIHVREHRVAIRYETHHEGLEIGTHCRVGVLAEDQRRAGVMDEDVADPGLDAG